MLSHFRNYLVGISILLTSTIALAGVMGNTASAVVDNDPDCDNVAIIRCGVFSENAMREKAAKNDVPRVFNALGVSQDDLKGKFVDGIVWRDGRVTVGGKTVATGAKTAGRNYGGTPIPNTNNAGIYPTSKFVTEGQTAFVKMKANGTFDFAVIKACGNPVKATPKTVKEEETPTPTPAPSVKCVSLEADKISPTKYTFTARATMSGGATIEKYEFGFGDGKGITVAENVYTYEYAQPGEYKTNVVVHYKANGKTAKSTSPACERAVTVAKEQIEVCDLTTKQRTTIDKAAFDSTKHSMTFEQCNTVTPAATIRVCEIATKQIVSIKDNEFDSAKHTRDYSVCDEKEEEETPVRVIAETGPAAAVAGLFGSGAVSYGAFSYLQSRRNLINKLLGR